MSESCNIIIPLYNEEKGIEDLVTRWEQVIKSIEDAQIKLFIYNDGSTDQSQKELAKYSENRPWLHVIEKENQGHGPSIIKGYRDNLDTDWVFQADSDNEIPPEKFPDFWKARQNKDFVIGQRENRDEGIERKVLSFFAKLIISIFFGNKILDVNCPFRLMKASAFKDFFLSVPPNTFAPNVIMSGYAAKKKLETEIILVRFEKRKFGASSLDPSKLLKLGFKCAFETLFYRIFHY